MAQVALAMAKDKPEKPKYCTYSTVKLDSEVLLKARAASSLKGRRLQEWLSDLANEAAAQELGHKPIVRRRPPPRRPEE